ncbi:MAG: transposase [Deltaproteobacteria bacterium]|nr:transposase [Deltaproteobacteria bacterium]
MNVTGLNKDYAALAEGVVNRIRAMGLQIRAILEDRELFNLAAKIDKRIRKILERHKRENGRKNAIFKYKFKDERSPEFYLVAIPNPDYDPAKREGKGNRDFYLFATSIAFGSVEEFVKRVPKEYRRRWKIETGYRVKKEFKIRTCSRSYVARVLFFVIQCIMHNFLNVLKRILRIAAHQLKSRIVEDIEKYLCDGKFVNTLPLRVFYAKMASYNERRVMELRCQLAAS